MKATYHIDNLSLEDLKSLSIDKEFTKYWDISKDKIEVCKLCEYRYLCVDPRIPIHENNKWYFDSDCEYNPVTGKWANEIMNE